MVGKKDLPSPATFKRGSITWPFPEEHRYSNPGSVTYWLCKLGPVSQSLWASVYSSGNGDSNMTYVIGLLWKVNKWMHVKHLPFNKCLVHDKCSVNIRYNYYHHGPLNLGYL